MARYYDIKGRIYPSVTTILDVIRRPGIERWRGNVGNEEADRQLEEARDLGSQVHDCCQRIALGEPLRLPASEAGAKIVLAYQEWFERWVDRVVGVERVVWDDQYGYAGRYDLLAVLRGDSGPALLDLKTSRSIYPEVALQLAAYRKPAGAHRRLVVHLDKCRGKITVKEYRDHERDFRVFLYAQQLWAWMQEQEGGMKHDSADIVRVAC